MSGAELEVRNEWLATSPVVISNSSAYIDLSGTFEAPVEIQGGGRLQSYGAPATFKSTLTVNQGGSLIFNGEKATLTIEGGLAAANFSVIAQEGAVIGLPQLTDYQGGGDFDLFRPAGTLFQANDRGSRIALPELISANGPVNWNVRSIPSIVFQAR